jgi:glycosyltransferase involved in cell wall biosynthesis
VRIAVAAEPVRNGAGLGTFVVDAMRALAKARPHWRFLVVASSWYSEIEKLDGIRNIDVLIWDKNGLRKKILSHTRHFWGRTALLNYSAKFAPSRALRLSLGNLTEIWRSLPGFDVLWVPYFDNSRNCWPALYKRGLIRCPILHTIHDLNPLYFPDVWKEHPQAWRNFSRAFIHFTHRSQCVITHSNFQKTSIIEHLKIRPEKLFVVYIPMSVPQDLYQNHPKEEVRRVLARFEISKPYAFSPLSQTAEHKNHARLLEVWVRLERKLGNGCPMLVFTIKGDKRWQKEFERVIQSFGIQDKVVFTGLVDKRELAILYQECEFVIFPSLYEGGGGYPVLEGCAIGKPVLCSRIPPILEQVQRFNLRVIWFDPNCNESIIEAIENVLALPIEERVRTDCMLNENLEADWLEFGESYAQRFQSIAGVL